MSDFLPTTRHPTTPPMIVSKQTIERQALAAARAGQSLNHACPYPFASEAGVHFKAVYLLAVPNAAHILRATERSCA